MFGRYSTKTLDAVISKRQLIPQLTNQDILTNQIYYMTEFSLTSIGRIYTIPFGFLN